MRTEDGLGIGTGEVRIGRLRWSRSLGPSHQTGWSVAAADAPASGGNLVPHLDRVWSIRCLGGVVEDGQVYIAYELDIGSKEGPRVRARPSLVWRVLAHPRTKVPLKIISRNDTEHPILTIRRIETRTYEATIEVEPPRTSGER